MGTKESLHEGFPGYNTMPLEEADKFVRERICGDIDNLLAHFNECAEKVRKQGREKLFSEVESLRGRVARIKKEMESRKVLCLSGDLLLGITHLDEEQLRSLDLEMVGLLDECRQRVDSMSCSEADNRALENFSRMNTCLRMFEEKFHEKLKAYRKEVFS